MLTEAQALQRLALELLACTKLKLAILKQAISEGVDVQSDEQ